MQVVVYGRKYKEQDHDHIQQVFDVLREEGFNTYVYTPYLQDIAQYIQLGERCASFDDYRSFKVHRIDFVIVLGGDGTMLNAVTLVRDSGVPMLGINLGRLGFLNHTEKGNIRDALQKLRMGMYQVEERSTLYLESTPHLFGETNFALNDFTILKRDTGSMITVRTYVNGDFLNTYWADGIVLATPTGSTGYSLSCGGPVITPNSENFVLTPVAPHNLNVRPIVLSDNCVVSFELEGRGENFICTLDSRFEIIGLQHQLAVRKNDFKVRLIQLQDDTFLRTIRDKLAWGKDLRN
jgi:NAD+ kinase